MSFLGHIKRCNRCDINQFLPWTVSGERAGYVHKQIAAKLLTFPKTFSMESNKLKMSDNLRSNEERSWALDEILKTLRDDGFCGVKLNEEYSVKSGVGQPPLLMVDRGAAELFGILSTGFHLNGSVGEKET